MVIREVGFSPKLSQALINEEYPLESCYQAWLKTDDTYMENLHVIIGIHAKKLAEKHDMER
jgi:hypothetical protein